MNRLDPGASLKLGESLRSPNGMYELRMQPDGNLVLFDGSDPVWTTNTQRQGAERVEMGSDGNLVVYAAKNRVVWSSRTEGHRGTSLVLQDDRNLVLYPASGNPLWATATFKAAGGAPARPPAVPPATPGAAVPRSAGPSASPGRPAAPGASTKSARTYKVARGDSLWRIAEKFYGNGPAYQKIAEANGIPNPDLIRPGQDLVIPE